MDCNSFETAVGVHVCQRVLSGSLISELPSRMGRIIIMWKMHMSDLLHSESGSLSESMH